MKLKLTPTNLKAIGDRAEALVQGLIGSQGEAAWKKIVHPVVTKEYTKNFNQRGGKFGKKWRSTKGTVDLVDTDAFKDSFRRDVSFEFKTVGKKLIIEMTSDYVSPRLNADKFIILLAQGISLTEKHSIKIDMVGPVGGVSRGAVKTLRRGFREVVKLQARRVKYKVS